MVNQASHGLIWNAKTPRTSRMIPTVRCSRERRRTNCSRRDAERVRNPRISISAARAPPLRPIYRRSGAKLGGWPVLWSTRIEGLLLLGWSCAAGGPRGGHLLIHPIELRLQLNQFAQFLRGW